MRELKTLIKNNPTATLLELAGEFNEFSSLPTINAPIIHVDLDKVTLMNSYGVKTWYLWVSQLNKNQKVLLTKCPYCFMKHAASFDGFLSKKMEVQSIYVPYYCEDSDETKDVLWVLDIDFFKNGNLKPPHVTSKAGKAMTPDVTLEDYFSFLKNK